MSIEYSILDNFNINKELVIPHMEHSAQIKKYVEGICNTELIKSTRTRQAKGLKEMMLHLGEWYCSCCEIQFYKQSTYNKHILGVEHRAKSNNKNIIVCSNSKCRKKCVGVDGLDIHLDDSPQCANTPNNIRVNHFENIMQRVNREKEVSNLYNHYREKMTEKDIIDWNCMIRREHGWNPKMLIIKDPDLLIRAVVKEKFTEEDKQNFNESIRKDYAGRTDVEFIEDKDGLIHGKVKTIFDEENLKRIKEDELIKEESAKRVKNIAEAQKEQMEKQKEASLIMFGIKSKSLFDKHTTYSGSSSDEYEEIEISDDEKEIKEI